ncbi:MAG: hypothetical protein ABIN67_03485 [Ferruginibacter sp.]
MKTILAALLIISANAFSQINIDALISETKQIMTTLHIKIRDSIKFDGHITFQLTTALPQGGASFLAGDELIIGKKTITRVYKHPTMQVTKYIDSVLTNDKSPTSIKLIEAKAVLVHELCHYLQATIPKKTSLVKIKMTRKQYVGEPDEIEAHAVQSYYTFKYFDPAIIVALKKIPIKEDIELWEMLIDADLITYKRPPLFNRHHLNWK